MRKNQWDNTVTFITTFTILHHLKAFIHIKLEMAANTVINSDYFSITYLVITNYFNTHTQAIFLTACCSISGNNTPNVNL